MEIASISEGVGVDGSKRMFFPLLDHILQVKHRLTFSNTNGERAVGYIANPTENCELIIGLGYFGTR